MADDDEKVLTLIKHGGAIGGAATGSVLGFLAGGPIGAAIGGAVGATLQTVATEIVDRELSRREKMRVGGTASYAIDFIRERLERGEHPREDTFLSENHRVIRPPTKSSKAYYSKRRGTTRNERRGFMGYFSPT